MYYITAARFPRESYEMDDAVRERAEKTRRHLEELALDSGLDPEKNVTLTKADDEVRIGVSEEFDEYLREAPGTWRHY